MNLHTEFSDAYRKRVQEYMDLVRDDLCTYHCKYTDTDMHTYFYSEYSNSGHEVQMDVTYYYRIPTAICCLVESHSIVKLHANILRLGIDMDFNWSDIPRVQIGNSCSQCGTYINHDKRMWINAQGDEFCKVCYHNAIDDNPKNKFTETIKYVNMLDFVLFMEEDIEDKRNQSSKFYVNCNPQSPYYGSIINREVCYADEHIDYIYHADQLLDQITEWLEWVPQESDYDRPDEFISDTMLSVDYVQECETFLHKTSHYAHTFSALFADVFVDTTVSTNVSNKFFLENRDVWFLPNCEEVEDPQMYEIATVELNRIKDCAVRHAEEMLLDIMQYKNHKCRSFTYMQLKFK